MCVKQADMKMYPGFIGAPQLQVYLQISILLLLWQVTAFWPLICILHDMSGGDTGS